MWHSHEVQPAACILRSPLYSAAGASVFPSGEERSKPAVTSERELPYAVVCGHMGSNLDRATSGR